MKRVEINEKIADIVSLFLTYPLLLFCFELPLHGFVLLEIIACFKLRVICEMETRL